jgi:molybdopterin-guanine dinucleotide biosynthesis protein A
MPERERITGLILAGGRGTRMGSIDKGLQLLGGLPLFVRTLDRLQAQVGAILISANRHRDRYAASGHRVVEDRIDDHAGPLAGMQAGLAACTTEFLVATPCDAPFFPRDLVVMLGCAFDDEGDVVDIAVARTAERIHPVFCMMRATLAPELDAFLDAGGRSVHAWVDRLRTRTVSFGDEASFRNINSIEELRRAESDVED